MGRFITLLSATATFGAFGLLIYWGISLSQMDPNEIPVIKRQAGPAREKPAEPGGLEIDHQGLSVNTVQAIGGAGKPSERVILAPQGDALSPEDRAGLAVEETPIDKPAAVEDIVETSLAPTGEQEASSEIEQAIVAGLTKPKPSREPKNTLQAQSEVVTQSDDLKIGSGEILAPENDIKRPKHRPDNLSASKVVTPQPAPAQKKPELKSGTPVAQIGSYESRKVAEAEWAKAKNQLGELLERKSPFYQVAKVSGKTYHRLRVTGFTTFEDAKSFCVASKAKGRDCLPTKIR